MTKTVDCDELRAMAEDQDDNWLVRADVRAHLQVCPACSALFEPLGAFEPLDAGVELSGATARGGGPSLALMDHVFDSAAGSPMSLGALIATESRRAFDGWSTSRRRSVLALTLIVPVTMGLVRHRVDWAVYPRLRMALVLAFAAAFTLFFLRRVVQPLYRPEPRVRDGVAGPVGAALLLLLLGVLPEAESPHPLSLLGREHDFAPRAVSCLLWGTGAAAASAVLGHWLAWGRGRWAVVVGTTAIALFALQLHCPLTHRGHLVVGHGGVLLGVALVVAGAEIWQRIRMRENR